jgi:hypothetical protein
MNMIFKKITLAVFAAVLALGVLAVTSVFAQGENPPRGGVTVEKLEQIWARELSMYEKLGKAFSDTDSHVAKFQEMIDRASANGKDVTALQAALDAYESALNNARPTYNSLASIINAHSGFDANGKVTDEELAKATVREVGETMKEIKSAMGGTFKALRDAAKAFRDANRPQRETFRQDDV